VRFVVRQCLQKDPKQRLGDMQSVRLALTGAFETTVRAASPEAAVARPPLWWQTLPRLSGALILGGVIVGVAMWALMRAPAGLPSRFTVGVPLGVVLGPEPPVLSPDGRTLAFLGVGEAGPQVYLRPLDQLDAFPLRGTEGHGPLAFSPDGEALLIADARSASTSNGGTVKRLPVTGGPATTIAVGHVGANRGPDGTVVLGTIGGGLRRIGAAGGDTTPLTTLAEGEVGHLHPTFLPNGRAVLFVAWSGTLGTAQVAVYDFETRQRTNLLPGTTPQFAGSGHLVFYRDESLWAVPFDPDRLEVRGTPVAIVEGVEKTLNGAQASYALAGNGTLVYVPSGATTSATLGWVSREGQMTTPLVEGPGLANPRLSPDGSQVAFEQSSDAGTDDIWVRDLTDELTVRVTESDANDWYPVWTPDGTTVTFSSIGDGAADGTTTLYSRPTDRSDAAQRVLADATTEDLLLTAGNLIPAAWTPDGQTLVYYRISGGDRDIWSLPSTGDPEAFLATAFNERAPRLSPNGQWLAYVSDQAGEDRVYVQAFPAKGGSVYPLSPGLGTGPVWSRDGRELFYRSGDELWAVAVETGPDFAAEGQTLLFEASYEPEPNLAGNPNYDVSLDGQQFLMVQQPAGTGEATDFTVVLNWFEELKRLVPTN
jgi:Tol biopolymer transport system component